MYHLRFTCTKGALLSHINQAVVDGMNQAAGADGAPVERRILALTKDLAMELEKLAPHQADVTVEIAASADANGFLHAGIRVDFELPAPVADVEPEAVTDAGANVAGPETVPADPAVVGTIAPPSAPTNQNTDAATPAPVPAEASQPSATPEPVTASPQEPAAPPA